METRCIVLLATIMAHSEEEAHPEMTTMVDVQQQSTTFREKFFMSIICFVAVWNSATQGYDSSMMVR